MTKTLWGAKMSQEDSPVALIHDVFFMSKIQVAMQLFPSYVRIKMNLHLACGYRSLHCQADYLFLSSIVGFGFADSVRFLAVGERFPL